MRSELFRASVPAASTRTQRFSRLAAGILDRIRRRAAGELDEVVLAFDIAPLAADGIELGRVFPATPERPATIVLHRMPIVSRCSSRSELLELLGEVISEQAGLLCGRDPEELWPR